MRCLKWPSPVRRCATYSCASSCVGDVSCRALLGLDCYKRTCGLPPSDCLRPRLSLKEHDSSLAIVLSPQATPSAVVLSCCQKLPYFSRRFHIYIYIYHYISISNSVASFGVVSLAPPRSGHRICMDDLVGLNEADREQEPFNSAEEQTLLDAEPLGEESVRLQEWELTRGIF